MDEGINTYYDNRYATVQTKPGAEAAHGLSHRLQNPEGALLSSIEAVKKDQPINTASDQFNQLNDKIQEQ